MLTSETKRRIDSCRDVLVGKLPLPTDQVELITLALIYKFMDDLDEESVGMGGRRSFLVGDLATYRWRALLPQTISAETRLSLFAQGIEAIAKAEHMPGLFRDIFRNAFLKFRDGRILTLFLTEINGFQYSHSEELGNAFEYLLQCMGTQGENGQFRTPRHIIDFIIACLDPQPHERILDPACGTAGFLVSAYKHILAKSTSADSAMPGDRLTHDQRQRLYRNLTGYDITDLMVKLSKVNLFLHGFPDPAIHIYDTLSNDARWDEKADVIAANPPFMTPKGGVTPHSRFRVAAKKAEVLFTDYIAEHLTPNGRAGVIVPNGIVATTQNAYVQLRKFLVEDSLVAVVSLPAGVFKPYSGVKTSILFLDKALARRIDQVLFLKVTADGFDLGDKRNAVEANDLPEAERVVRGWMTGVRGADAAVATTVVGKGVLLEHHGCSLQAELYFDDKATVGQGGMVAIGDVATVASGGTPSKSIPAFWEGDIPWVSPKDMKNHVIEDTEDHISIEAVNASAARLVPAGTVLCVVRSGILKHTFPVAVTTREVSYNQDIVAISTDPSRLDATYLLFTLRGRSADILQNGVKTGVTVQSFHSGFLRSYRVPIPPLHEQRRIVAEIEGYQKVIDGARQILAAWTPSFACDADWERRPLGDLAQFEYGHTATAADTGPVRYVRITDINECGTLCPNDARFTELSTAAETCLLRSGDILVARIGATCGKTLFFDSTEPAVFASYLIRVTFSAESGVLPKYYWYFTQGEGYRQQRDRLVGGGGQPQLNANALKQLDIPLPPVDVQRRIVAELDAESTQIEAVRGIIPRFEAKIQRVMDRVWGAEPGGAP